MKNKVLLFASLFLAFFIMSCSNSDNSEEVLEEPTEEERNKKYEEDGDIIPDDFLEALNKGPIVHLNEGDLELPNGLKFSDFHITLEDLRGKSLGNSTRDNPNISAVSAKNAIIKQLSATARKLTVREEYQYKDEGKNKPAQNGLAFVFGSREITKRNKYSPWTSSSPCDDYLHGVDCSGYIYRIFNDNSIPLEVGRVKDYHALTPIKKALEKRYPGYELEVKNLGKIPMKDFEPGDFVFWKKGGVAFHMGLVLKRGKFFLANSSGGPEACEINKSENGGPLIRSYEYIEQSLGDYDIIRISVANAWVLYSRWEGASQEFQRQTIHIDVSQSSQEKEVFYFYDSGRILKTEMVYTYDKYKNTINGTTITYDGKELISRPSISI